MSDIPFGEWQKKHTHHFKAPPDRCALLPSLGPVSMCVYVCVHKFWMSQSVGAVSTTSSVRYQQSRDSRTNKQHLGDLQLQHATPACLHCNLSQMKPRPSPLSIIHTLCTHNMTIRPIHADAPFLDQSSQSASCKHAYCWIIHSFHRFAEGKKKPPCSAGQCAFSPMFAVQNNAGTKKSAQKKEAGQIQGLQIPCRTSYPPWRFEGVILYVL